MWTVRNVQKETCVCVRVCVVCCTFVDIRDCDCDCDCECCARARDELYARIHTYLTRVSKKTNTLDKDIDLYREYMFVYPLYIDTYITELLGNSLIYVRFVYT